MSAQHAEGWNRRAFLGGLTLAGTAGLLGVPPRPVAAETPPETTRIRLVRTGSTCQAPQYLAEALLQSEGFSDVHYVPMAAGADGGTRKTLASGQADISTNFAGPNILGIEVGEPLVILAGGHIGCWELFGTERVCTIRDLKDKVVALPEGGIAEARIYLTVRASYVGLDPRKDMTGVTHPSAEAMHLLAEGKIDAFLAFPPYAQEVRAKHIGPVMFVGALDRPWSQYFCCRVVANRACVRQHPVATKRALRAILKATDVCALEPERASQSLTDRGVATRYDYALQTMKDIPSGNWREYDPEDTVRFYALRLHEAGLIKSTPQRIIVPGTD
jgi:NitT/TauT family transport system substrate-binding protein